MVAITLLKSGETTGISSGSDGKVLTWLDDPPVRLFNVRDRCDSARRVNAALLVSLTAPLCDFHAFCTPGRRELNIRSMVDSEIVSKKARR